MEPTVTSAFRTGRPCRSVTRPAIFASGVMVIVKGLDCCAECRCRQARA